MNLKNRLFVVAVVFALASLSSGVLAAESPSSVPSAEKPAEKPAQEKFDVTFAGQANAKQEALAFLALEANKPKEDLVVTDAFFAKKFIDPYTFVIPKSRTNSSEKKATLTLAGATGFPFHVANEIRKTMLEAAKSTPPNVFDTWINDKQPELIDKLKKLRSEGLPDSASIIVGLFLKDWFDEVMNSVNRESNDQAKAEKLRLALKQAAYQYTNEAVGIQKKIVEITTALAPVGSPSGTSSSGGGAAAREGSGSHHADVFHARRMNGIYRRHDRHMNQIERITARR